MLLSILLPLCLLAPHSGLGHGVQVSLVTETAGDEVNSPRQHTDRKVRIFVKNPNKIAKAESQLNIELDREPEPTEPVDIIPDILSAEEDTSEILPPLPSGWSEWGPWASCDTTCGDDGKRPRHRYCLPAENQACQGVATDYEACTTKNPCKGICV